MTLVRTSRCRWQLPSGAWRVQSRVERFVEPSLLLLLHEHPRHGYELAQELTALVGDDASVDFGNLYRQLRSLEAEHLVTSAWRPQATGPPRRTYQLTPAGRALLGQWVDALGRTQAGIAGFLRRYQNTSPAELKPPSTRGARRG